MRTMEQARTIDAASGRRAAEQMTTLACPSCQLALYLPTRKVQLPTWQCPACRTMIQT